MNPELSVIIVNFNTLELTRNCIQSVIDTSSSVHLEIIIVDNASVSSPASLVKEFPGIRLLENKKNLGFGVANNIGMQAAKGRYLLLLNSDTIVKEQCLDACIHFMDTSLEKRDNIGMIGCQLLNPDFTLQPSIFPYLKNTPWILLKTTNPLLIKLTTIFGINKHLSFDFSKTQQVGDIAGAFMFLRREVFEKTGGFDPDFFLYGEDTEWCRERVSRFYEIYYLPQAKVVHMGGQSAPGDLMFDQSLLSNGLMWYKKGNLSYLAYLIITAINILTGLILFPFGSANTRNLTKKYVRGYFTIVRQLFFDIPAQKRHFGARTIPLAVKHAHNVFFSGQAR